MAHTERLAWITVAAVTFICGGEIEASRKVRNTVAMRAEGLEYASQPIPATEKNCEKQAIKEYLHACAKRKSMEKIKL